LATSCWTSCSSACPARCCSFLDAFDEDSPPQRRRRPRCANRAWFDLQSPATQADIATMKGVLVHGV